MSNNDPGLGATFCQGWARLLQLRVKAWDLAASDLWCYGLISCYIGPYEKENGNCYLGFSV